MQDDAAYAAALQNPKLHDAVLASLTKDAKDADLRPVERVTRFWLCPEHWTTENGLLTTTNKIKRSELARRYADQLALLFA